MLCKVFWFIKHSIDCNTETDMSANIPSLFYQPLSYLLIYFSNKGTFITKRFMT